MCLSTLAAHAHVLAIRIRIHKFVATHSLRGHCIFSSFVFSGSWRVCVAVCLPWCFGPPSAAALNDKNNLYSILRVCMRSTVDQNEKKMKMSQFKVCTKMLVAVIRGRWLHKIQHDTSRFCTDKRTPYSARQRSFVRPLEADETRIASHSNAYCVTFPCVLPPKPNEIQTICLFNFICLCFFLFFIVSFSHTRRIQNHLGKEHNVRLRCSVQTVDRTKIDCVPVQSGRRGINIEQPCVHR